MLLVSILIPSASERHHIFSLYPNSFCPLDTIQGTSVSFMFEISSLQISCQVILPQIVARSRPGVHRDREISSVLRKYSLCHSFPLTFWGASVTVELLWEESLDGIQTKATPTHRLILAYYGYICAYLGL